MPVNTQESRDCSFTICGGLARGICGRAGVAEGVIMKIGGWRTRSVFERYAIVSRKDIADAIFKLQESEKRTEQERVLTEAQRQDQEAGLGGESSPLSRAVS